MSYFFPCFINSFQTNKPYLDGTLISKLNSPVKLILNILASIPHTLPSFIFMNGKASFEISISVRLDKNSLELGPEILRTVHCSVTEVQKTSISSHSV